MPVAEAPLFPWANTVKRYIAGVNGKVKGRGQLVVCRALTKVPQTARPSAVKLAGGRARKNEDVPTRARAF